VKNTGNICSGKIFFSKFNVLTKTLINFLEFYLSGQVILVFMVASCIDDIKLFICPTNGQIKSK
jgi:hypothetical protein